MFASAEAARFQEPETPLPNLSSLKSHEKLLYCALVRRAACVAEYCEALQLKPATLSFQLGDPFKKLVANLLKVPAPTPGLEDNVTHQKFNELTTALKALAHSFQANGREEKKVTLTEVLREILINCRVEYLEGRTAYTLYKLRYEFPSAPEFGVEGELNPNTLRARRLTGTITQPETVRRLLLALKREEFNNHETLRSQLWDHPHMQTALSNFVQEQQSKLGWSLTAAKLYGALQVVGITVSKTALRASGVTPTFTAEEIDSIMEGRSCDLLSLRPKVEQLLIKNGWCETERQKVWNYILQVPPSMSSNNSSEIEDLRHRTSIPPSFVSLCHEVRQLSNPKIVVASPPLQPPRPSSSSVPSSISLAEASLPKRPAITQREHPVARPIAAPSAPLPLPMLQVTPKPPSPQILFERRSRALIETITNPIPNPFLNPAKGVEFNFSLVSRTYKPAPKSGLARVIEEYREHTTIFGSEGAQLFRDLITRYRKNSDTPVVSEEHWSNLLNSIQISLPGFAITPSARTEMEAILAEIDKLKGLATEMGVPLFLSTTLRDASNAHTQNVAASQYLRANPTCYFTLLSRFVGYLAAFELSRTRR